MKCIHQSRTSKNGLKWWLFPLSSPVFPPLLACEAPETAWFGALRFADTYCSAAWPPMVSGLELVTPRKDVAPQFLLTVSSETMGPDLS